MSQAIRKAFTLIELLVVISIVALLVAILLPALSKARVSGQMSQSISNIRQLQIAQQMYANDNKGFISPPARSTTSKSWNQVLFEARYFSSPRILWSSARVDFTGNNFTVMTGTLWLFPGYGVNMDVIQEEVSLGVPLAVAPTKVFQIPNLGRTDVPPASKLMVLVEGFRPVSFTSNVADGRWGLKARANGASTEDSLFSYNGGVARAYLDGHATGGPGSELGFQPTSSRNGVWTYSNSDPRYKAPWYRYWESRWE